MESRKANLIIDVTKNVVEQYRDQLQKSIEENRVKELSDYGYENKVERAEICLDCVNHILENFEKSIFDGEITEDATYEANYTSEGRKLLRIAYNESVTKEQREESITLSGSQRVFEQIGIPTNALYPVIADIMERNRDINYKDGTLIEERVKRSNKLFNVDGIYNVGSLNINNLLLTQVTVDTGVLIYPNSTPVLYSQGKDLFLNIKDIEKVIDKYIEDGIKIGNLDDLESQNNFINDTFSTFSHYSTNIGADSSYYYKYFRKVFERGGLGEKTYYRREARKVKTEQDSVGFGSENALKTLKNQKQMLEKLDELNKEEQQLSSRLIQINEEKTAIIASMTNGKIFEKENSKPNDNVKNNDSDIVYVSETEYIRNGTHYHLPTLNDEDISVENKKL